MGPVPSYQKLQQAIVSAPVVSERIVVLALAHGPEQYKGLLWSDLAHLLLVASLLLVVRPGAPSSVLAPSRLPNYMG